VTGDDDVAVESPGSTPFFAMASSTQRDGQAAREKMSIPKLFIGTAETGACTFQNQLSLARGTRTRAGSASPWSHGQESANQMVAHRLDAITQQ
jgi:hypothetical protein